MLGVVEGLLVIVTDGSELSVTVGDPEGLMDGFEVLGDVLVDGLPDATTDGSELPVTVGDPEGLLDGVLESVIDGSELPVIDGSKLPAIVGDVDGLPEIARLGEELSVKLGLFEACSLGLEDGTDVVGAADGSWVSSNVGDEVGAEVSGVATGESVGSAQVSSPPPQVQHAVLAVYPKFS